MEWQGETSHPLGLKIKRIAVLRGSPVVKGMLASVTPTAYMATYKADPEVLHRPDCVYARGG